MAGRTDSAFPPMLFPQAYNTGPPGRTAGVLPVVGGWGVYGQIRGVDRLVPENAGLEGKIKIEAQHKVKGEEWRPTEPIVCPLLPPNSDCKIPSSANSHALDFPEHLRNFYLDNHQDAFGTMSRLLDEHFYFGYGNLQGSVKENTRSMRTMMDFIENVGYRKCPLTYVQKRARSYSYLFDDVIYDIPPALLGELLHEELMMQSDRELFQEAATGGAMGYIPFEETDASQQGYLVYPRKAALNHLYFHKVVLEFQEDGGPRLSVRNKPVEFKLNGTIRQISADCVQDQVHVGVRSDYHCGVWKVCGWKKPKALEVVQTEQMATCINVRLQKLRAEAENLYFNAQSAWRWCDHTAHPRIVIYADRTGVELTDTRSPERHGQTLFRIGETAECKQRERVILPRYLRDVNAYHYLITTQYSAYIMDERFPGLPMIKWEHMMKYPPMFTQVLAGAPWGRSSKVLLGSQCCQELMLLQYSGGSQAACQSLGPPQKLCSPPDCLKHLPIQIPHRQESVAERLRSPGAGLAALYHNQGMESLCVLQLSAAGDIFYQMLRPESDPGSEDVPISTESTAEEAEEMRAETGEPNLDHTSDSDLDDTRSEAQDDETAVHRVEVMTNRQAGQHLDSEIHLQADGETGEPVPVNRTDCTRSALAGSRPGRSPTIPMVASKKVLSRWKRWMAALFDMAERAPRETNSLWVVSTKKLMFSRAFRKHASEDGRYEEVKRELKETMRSRGVLQGSRTHLKALERVPLPEAVAPLDWGDDLSRRLTVAWEGRWNNWWVEKLGLNRDQKIMALRQKRKRQKESRARRRPALPASFTSSVGYQSDLDDRMSWCSATSNFGDGQSVASLSATQSLSAQEDVLPASRGTKERTPVLSAPSRSEGPEAKSLSDSSVSSRVARLPPGNKVVAPPDDPDEPDAGSFSTLGSPRPTGILKPSGSFARSEQEWVPGHGSQNSQPARKNDLFSSPTSRPATQGMLKMTNQEAVDENGFSFLLSPTSQTFNISSTQTHPCVMPSSQSSVRSSQPKKKRSRMGF
ncbi:TATA box-binding protein-associated factor, RNA polymerase I, subunit C isoform X2 [Lepisosteus oculatus]|uniref:TATA box-binding protein-associated factor, RNA polymerase I, subunit C isoform X2 n=1 Tax=Lepisosteus oculatus TaxID=7918 RepID=UPI003723D593